MKSTTDFIFWQMPTLSVHARGTITLLVSIWTARMWNHRLPEGQLTRNLNGIRVSTNPSMTESRAICISWCVFLMLVLIWAIDVCPVNLSVSSCLCHAKSRPICTIYLTPTACCFGAFHHIEWPHNYVVIHKLHPLNQYLALLSHSGSKELLVEQLTWTKGQMSCTW